MKKAKTKGETGKIGVDPGANVLKWEDDPIQKDKNPIWLAKSILSLPKSAIWPLKLGKAKLGSQTYLEKSYKIAPEQVARLAQQAYSV